MTRCSRETLAVAILFCSLSGRALADDPAQGTAQAGPPQSGQATFTGTRFAIGPAPNNAGNPSGVSGQPRNNVPPEAEGIGDLSTPVAGPALRGLFPAFGDELLSDGIDVHGFLFDHFLANPSAGIRRGQTGNLGVVSPTVDLDLQKLLGIAGGDLHVQGTFYGPRTDEPNIIKYTGGYLDGFQTTPALSDNWFILNELTYEQKLDRSRLSIEVGRTNLFHYFLLPNSLDPFTFYSGTVTVDGDVNSTPFPVWGGRVNYHLTPAWYAQFGVFEDNYYRATNTPLAFGTSDAAGVLLIGDVDYRTTFQTARYPSNYEFGVDWNTRHGYGNVKGSPYNASPSGTGADYPGGGTVFYEGLQTVARGRRQARGQDAPPPNVAVYESLDVAYDKPQPIDGDGIVGINVTGLTPGRPFDALGLQVRYQLLGPDEARFESHAHDIFAGPGPDQNRSGFQFEAVYNLSFDDVLQVRPLAEYFVNPDNLGDFVQKKRPANGFELGVFATMSIGRALGTSTKPF